MSLGGNYQFFKDPLPFAQAEKSCVTKGGHLASILSETQQNEVEEEVREEGYSSYFWIGGRRRSSTDDTFEWSDGSAWSEYNDHYSGYVESNGYRCLYVSSYWYFWACSYAMPYVCQFPQTKQPQSVYQFTRANLTGSGINFWMDLPNESLKGVEVPGFKVGFLSFI